MEDLFAEIERGLDAGVYQLALGMALCIPDLCAALESKNGRTNGIKYQAWYDKYVDGKMYLTASDCYHIRCSFLHQGSPEQKPSIKILFIVPSGDSQTHDQIMNGALHVDINIFCQVMIAAGQRWLLEVKDSENYIKNYEKSFKRYSNGLAPFIAGTAVFA
ncbi:hypothetical protein [Peribacillus kribbensis]|uniref:hypothetical protein n=1 Tax=Peribacillus kribbensis TaxID=356658 RepID=UPI000409587D|nr:hypothetical protein [Peribacillus kribbensis]